MHNSDNSDELSITPEEVYRDRREILAKLGFAGAGAVLAMSLQRAEAIAATVSKAEVLAKPTATPASIKYAVTESDRPLTKEELALSYNNYYEFSLDKKEVKAIADKWKRPAKWTIRVSGHVEKPLTLDLDELTKSFGTEERVYRFRCVEAWSMVLPWSGFPLASLIDRVKPTAKAKYVKFVTHVDAKAMPNISKMPYYPWPYTEGLTIEEAKHPLAFMATGLYKKNLANQNGAPIRLVVPWKYGFKSIKSVDAIEFTESAPSTLWQKLAPDEYGFFANVNPDVPHPRWSQARETRIDGSFFPTKITTLKFNGYEKEVAGLYTGLDLKKNY